MQTCTTLQNTSRGISLCSVTDTHLELTERVLPVDELPPPVDLQGVVLWLLLAGRPEDCGLLPQGLADQRTRHVLGLHLEHEALLGAGRGAENGVIRFRHGEEKKIETEMDR